MNKNFDPRTAVFTPAETAARGLEYVQSIEKNKHRAMPLDMPQIGEYLAALMPGEICAIQAQTHNYKSGFMNMWENMLVSHLKAAGREEEIVIRVDTETSIEGMAIQEIARHSSHTVADLSRGNVRNWEELIWAADKVAGIDIYRVAASLGRDDIPDLYLSNIYRSIQYITTGKLLDKPLRAAAIFVDYLQALPLDPETKKGAELKHQRRLQVREDVYRLRQMAVYFNCPVIVGVQAKQNLSGSPGPNMLIPGIYDGEETSSIAQRFDRIISLWMPKTTHSVGQRLRHGTAEFEVTEEALWLRVLKQRGGLPSGRSWRCRIDFKKNRLAVER